MTSLQAQGSTIGLNPTQWCVEPENDLEKQAIGLLIYLFRKNELRYWEMRRLLRPEYIRSGLAEVVYRFFDLIDNDNGLDNLVAAVSREKQFMLREEIIDYLQSCEKNRCPAFDIFTSQDLPRLRLSYERGLIMSVLRGLPDQVSSSESPLITIQNEIRTVEKEIVPVIDCGTNGLISEVEAHINSNNPSGHSTGFAKLDSFIGGINTGLLVVLAGRTSLGKTSLALNLLLNILREGGNCLFTSLETDRCTLYESLLAIEGCIPRSDFMHIENKKKLFDCISHADKNLKSVIGDRLKIVDQRICSSIRSIGEIEAIIKSQNREAQLDFAVIDYFGLLDHNHGFNRHDLNMGESSHRLQKLAKDTGTTILLLSQMNRSSDREIRRPLLSDIRECGSLEEDADIVLSLWKEPKFKSDFFRENLNSEQEYHYERDVKLSESVPLASPYKRLSIMKNKLGGVGDISLYFKRSILKFEEIGGNNDL